jgi:hypothetical protein
MADKTPQDAWVEHPAIGVDTSPYRGGAKGEKTTDGISTKFAFDLSPKAKEGKLGRYVNGKIGLKMEVSGEISTLEADNKIKAGGVESKDGAGFKGEIELIKGKFESTLMGSEFTEWKTSVGFELSTKKVDINAGVTFKIQTPISWLAAVGGIKFKVVEADWKKLSGEKAPTVAAAELSGGTQVERTITPQELGLTGLYKLKVTVKCTIAGQVSPDWSEIFSDVSKDVYEQGMKKAAEEASKKAAEQAAKKVAEQAAKKATEQAAKEAAKTAAEEAAKRTAATAAETAGEVIAMDGAALASAAAAILLPAAAVVAIGAGMVQEARNMKADAVAIATGLATRERAAKAATVFARVMCGGSGSGEGAKEAESQIAEMMRKANASREQAVEAIEKAQGGFGDLRTRELKRLKDKLYAAACTAFDEGHKDAFGFLENRGETWGFRGSFRKMLSLILYD